MKHTDGIHVSIFSNGEKIKEFTNLHEKRHEDFHGAFGSRLIGATPGEPFEVAVSFHDSFKTYSATGILICISVGNHLCQEILLRCATMNIHASHHIAQITTWSADRPDATATKNRLRIPVVDPNYPTASFDWMVSDLNSANPGCVSIPISRVKGDESEDTTSKYSWVPSDSPISARDVQGTGPTIVRGEWYRVLNIENGLPYLFEYRVVKNEDLSDNSVEDDGEIGHDPGLKEDELDSEGDVQRLRGGRYSDEPWGSAAYDPFEPNTTTKRKHNGVENGMKLRRVGERANNASRMNQGDANLADREDEEEAKPEIKAESLDEAGAAEMQQHQHTPREEIAATPAAPLGAATRALPLRQSPNPGASGTTPNSNRSHPTTNGATTANDQPAAAEHNPLQNGGNEIEDIQDLRDELEEANLRAEAANLRAEAANFRADAVRARRNLRQAEKRAGRVNGV